MWKTYIKVQSALKLLTLILHCKAYHYGHNVAMGFKNAR